MRPRRELRSPMIAPANSSGTLKGKVVGVDVVIRTVVEHDLEVHHRISGQITTRGGVFDSLLDRGNKVPGNRAAKDVVDELELAAAGQRFHLDLAVAVLPVATGLLLVAPLHVGASTNGFAIWHLRR